MYTLIFSLSLWLSDEALNWLCLRPKARSRRDRRLTSSRARRSRPSPKDRMRLFKVQHRIDQTDMAPGNPHNGHHGAGESRGRQQSRVAYEASSNSTEGSALVAHDSVPSSNSTEGSVLDTSIPMQGDSLREREVKIVITRPHWNKRAPASVPSIADESLIPPGRRDWYDRYVRNLNPAIAASFTLRFPPKIFSVTHLREPLSRHNSEFWVRAALSPLPTSDL